MDMILNWLAVIAAASVFLIYISFFIWAIREIIITSDWFEKHSIKKHVGKQGLHL